MFEIELGTRNEEVIPAIQKILEVTKSFLNTPVSEEALKGAKSAAQRAFIFKFDSPEKVANRAVQQELMKFPPDYDSRYVQTVEDATANTILAIGKKWVHPENLAIVVVGRVPTEKFKEVFEPMGIPVQKMEFDELPRFAK